jgi:hypothetical protein
MPHFGALFKQRFQGIGDAPADASGSSPCHHRSVSDVQSATTDDSPNNRAGNAWGRPSQETIVMALAHVFALLRKLFRTLTGTFVEALELRRQMSRRHPLGWE